VGRSNIAVPSIYKEVHVLGHGLRTPNEAFFYWNLELLGLGGHIGQINSGAFGVFLAELSAPILVQIDQRENRVSPLSMFSIIQPLFLQKTNIYLGLGFEFGPQRIRDLAFVRLYSVC
jgi:hypothetical protein